MNNAFSQLRKSIEGYEARSLAMIQDQLHNGKGVFIYSKGLFEKNLSLSGITEENVEDIKGTAFISILNTDDVGDNKGHFSTNKSNVLVLYFDDISEDLEFQPGKFAKVITEDQAKEIIAFVERNKEIISNGNCIVHCSAGVSRSGAVGTFISDFLQFNYDEFRKNNPNIHPNPVVLSLLKRLAYYDDYKIED